MSKQKFYERSSKRSAKRTGRIALIVFTIAAVICEYFLISGWFHDPHPGMYGAMVAIMTAVFIWIGCGIHYITKQMSKAEEREREAAEKAQEAEAAKAEKEDE